SQWCARRLAGCGRSPLFPGLKYNEHRGDTPMKSALFAVTICTLVQAQDSLPAGSGRDVVQAACTQCHALNLVTRSGHSAAEWKVVVDQMISDGAQVPKEK